MQLHKKVSNSTGNRIEEAFHDTHEVGWGGILSRSSYLFVLVGIYVALRKLNDELRIFEYRSHFDMRVALDKSNHSFREARHYLHWQERLLYDKKVWLR